jgi:GntR family transcriptional regulator, transcriptional repressor for pyruvate dehydrogenase complex
MNPSLEPLRVSNLKDACVQRLEELILSGELKAGERLPSERDLAIRLNISRPVLHESLVELASRGLVTILPRRGVVINDYRKTGSCAILSSLLTYNNGKLDPKFTDSLFAMRLLVEVESATLAAKHATAEQVAELRELIDVKREFAGGELQALTGLDFDFHLLVAIASGNLVYPLILNSFKNVYTHFTGEFFRLCNDEVVIREVFQYQSRLVDAIYRKDSYAASDVMREMLLHGEQHLKGVLV